MKGFFASLRCRLLLLVLLAVLPAFGVIFYQAHVQRNDIQQRVTEQSLSLAHQVSKTQSDAIRDSQPLLTTLARLLSLVEGPLESIDQKVCDQFLTDVRLVDPTYANLGVIAADGSLICSALPFSSPVNLADRPYFKGAIQSGGFFIGDYQTGRVTLKSTINTAVPIVGPSGQVKGVVFAALDLRSISDLIEESSLPPGTVIHVLDGDGRVLMRHPDPESWIGRTFPESPIARISSAGAGTVRVPGLDGVDRLFSFVPLMESLGRDGPMVNVGIPATVAFAEVDRALARNLAIMGSAGLLALAATWLAGELFVLRRVRALVHTARKLTSGDLDARSGLAHGAGEINQLAGAFDDMAASLQARLDEVQESRKALQESHRNLEKALAELAQAQQQVIQQERLRALGQMASGVAHDFNNALSPILGYSDLLLMNPDYLGDRDKTVECLHRIKTAAQNAGDVVARLREFYRPREDTEEFHPVDLNELVEEVISLTQPRWQALARAQGGPIKVAFHPSQIPQVSGSEAQLRDLLINLVFNAVDAMPKGGTLTLQTQTYGGHVVLQVMDTGTGMTEEVRRRCMEPWFTTKGDQGTGLGLAMVYGIVQRHGGAVDIKSKVGEGATFTIRLPVLVAPEGLSEAPAAQTRVQPMHVLIVDDEPDVRQFLADYLTVDGHRVDIANDGREGLVKFLGSQFDLAVVDLAMPELSGAQLTVILKQLAPHMPVISLSGFGDLLEKPGSADLVLSKPVTVEELREAVVRVISGTVKDLSRV